MRKPNRREAIKLDILRGILTETQIKQKHSTTSDEIKVCKVELKNSNSLMKIDKKR